MHNFFSESSAKILKPKKIRKKIYQYIHAVKRYPKRFMQSKVYLCKPSKLFQKLTLNFFFFAISLFYTLLKIMLHLFNRRNQINRIIEIRLKCTSFFGPPHPDRSDSSFTDFKLVGRSLIRSFYSYYHSGHRIGQEGLNAEAFNPLRISATWSVLEP